MEKQMLKLPSIHMQAGPNTHVGAQAHQWAADYSLRIVVPGTKP